MPGNNIVVVDHPRLGRVTGRDGDSASFLGIPYATLAHRFAEPQLAVYPVSSGVDATKYGPTSPTPPGAFQLEMAMMQHSLAEPETATSDLHALNLNVTVPYLDGKLATTSKLPVFVWLHGGGFVSGSTSWPQYDMVNMVMLSAKKGLPIIGVTVGFRLGVLGFLTSKELRDAGCMTNNQLRDQIAALDWIREHIGGFGGDADNITLGGESTGAVEVGLHLQSKRPLFARAFMSGGSSLLMPPTTPETQERAYQQVVQALGLEAASPEERFHALITMPLADLMAGLTTPLPFRPMVDGDVVTHAVTYATVSDRDSTDIAARGWLKGLMVGDCQFDASSMAIFLGHKKAGIARTFPAHIRQSFKDEPLVEQLLEAYGFTPTLTDHDETGFKKYLHFLNDISYYAATIAFARGWAGHGSGNSSSSCHAFFINEGNPGEGMFKGEATHIMDVMMLFQNLNGQFPPALAASAEHFATDIFAFMHGGDEGPWPSCSTATQGRLCAKVYGPSSWEEEEAGAAPVSRVVDDILAPESGRRRVMIDLGGRIGFDALAQAVVAFNAS